MGYKVMRKKKILVIDDDEMNLQIAQMILEKKLPCEVFCASNGVEGLEILKNRRINLVLLDILMPDFDGIETLQEIRADEQIKSVSVMMLTATAEPETIKKARLLGVRDYIKKPFLPADLVARVEKKLSEIHTEEILLLGDDENRLFAMKNILEENFPHEALTAISTEFAEKILREAEISLIIADSDMKFINGYKFLAMPAAEKLPFAISSPEKILELVEKILQPEKKVEPEEISQPEEKIIEPEKISPPEEKIIVREEKKKIANVVTSLIGYKLV